MEHTQLQNSKKYKTIGELLKAPIKSIILVSVKEPDTTVRDYLFEWLFTNYYSKKEMTGNLTTRIRNINNKPCYTHIINHCFSGIEPQKTIRQILNTGCLKFIQDLHYVEPSMAGCFLDYLLRRTICFHKKISFEDSKASHFATNTDYIQKYVYDNMEEQIKTQLPMNMLECYNRTKNLDLKTEDILLEIFIVSLCHPLAFGGFPKQEKVDGIVRLLQSNSIVYDVFYIPIENLCIELLRGKQHILMNPCCGHKIPKLNDNKIPSDCDLVMDDNLYDIKSTSGDCHIYEILQLLGYASLINCNPYFGPFYNIRHGVKINRMSIINLFKGEITEYDISHIQEEQMLRYLKIIIS